jgi:hypothetical protein
MLDRLYAWLKRYSTWPVFTLLLFLFLLCSQGFQWRREVLGAEAHLLDVRMGYSPAQAVELLGALGPQGRGLYGLTEVTLDLVFPFLYGGMIASLLVNLVRGARVKYLLLLPLLTGLFDLLENATIAYLAWTFDGRESPLMWAASALTSAKNVLAILSVLAVLAVAGLALRPQPASPG